MNIEEEPAEETASDGEGHNERRGRGRPRTDEAWLMDRKKGRRRRKEEKEERRKTDESDAEWTLLAGGGGGGEEGRGGRGGGGDGGGGDEGETVEEGEHGKEAEKEKEKVGRGRSKRKKERSERERERQIERKREEKRGGRTRSSPDGYECGKAERRNSKIVENVYAPSGWPRFSQDLLSRQHFSLSSAPRAQCIGKRCSAARSRRKSQIRKLNNID
ncbi:LOW QUALITY PROTEIN: uncharacterized protein LOC116434045 [Nomia melanderi]|uniref:LOW QUALITY PROTEIN: uncharacterized protein LOC116434045 n=1 Tax=Nomia melanderi TaxID=2448451 RepID=UPI003FCC5DAD